jgi:acyl carrier protein
MSHLTALQLEVAELIIKSLNLEIEPTTITPEQALYREGLGLDSIDLLELSLVISKTYGFQIKSEDPENVQIFSTFGELTRTIENRRTL